MNITASILVIVSKKKHQYGWSWDTGWRKQWFHPIGINGGPPGRSKFGQEFNPALAETVGTVQMMKILKNLKLNKSGASAAEYALIVAVLGGLVVTGATTFGNGLNDVLDDAGTAMKAEKDADFSS